VVEWPTGELARRAGISPRTLRHYDQIGLLTPTRTSGSGLRFYDAWAVARLQRILLLRETGMSLAGIAELLDGETEGQEDEALEEQIRRLHRERDALDRKIRAVEHLLEARHEGRAPKPDVLLDGFNDLYEEEVVAHWGREAYQAGHDWWHGKTLAQQQAWKKRSERLVADWVRAQRAGCGDHGAVDGLEHGVQALREGGEGGVRQLRDHHPHHPGALLQFFTIVAKIGHGLEHRLACVLPDPGFAVEHPGNRGDGYAGAGGQVRHPWSRAHPYLRGQSVCETLSNCGQNFLKNCCNRAEVLLASA